MSRLSLYFLGSPRIEKDGASVEVDRRKAIALIAYLSVTDKSHSRDTLAALLWPEYNQTNARADLRHTLSILKKTLGDEWLDVGRETISLNRNESLYLDVYEFHSLLSQCRRHNHPPTETCPDCLNLLTKSVALYRDDFMAGFSLQDSSEFDDWQVIQSQSLRRELSGALQRVVRCHGTQGELEKAIGYAERLLGLDPLHEPAHRSLMELYAKAGQQADALRQYHECERVLKRELGISPHEETVELYDAIKENRMPVSEPSSGKPPAVPSNNLPVQLTSFIGRGREIEEVKRLLTTTRLLTLTGSGGCGKTRLAIQVASDLIEEFPDGVWLVELASLSDSSLVPQAVASALDVREQPGRPILATLSDYLKSKQILLVLDNCEHLIEACARLSESLLRACPKLQILATSRGALGIAGELTYRVPSLSLPDPKQIQSVSASDLTRYEAVRLFIERASFSQPTFVITDQNTPIVAQVCHRLDGIPLAIELAAARVNVLSVEQIAERLDDCFRLLTGGSRTALPRHQTLRATMDWSYGLLSEAEQALLRRLSVFAGGWTIEAAETICEDTERQGRGDAKTTSVSPHHPVTASGVLDLLTQLVNKSLVVMEEHSGEARYRLLETVRQYGREKLLEAGEGEAVSRRHLSWYLSLAERAESELHGPDHLAWLDRLEAEHDNMREALKWSLEVGEAEEGLRLAGALWWFWLLLSYFREGREWLERALSKSSGVSASARAKVLTGAGVLALRQGDHGQATTLLEEGLALSREMEDKDSIARSLGILGMVAQRQGDYRGAMALLEESLTLSREMVDEQQISTIYAVTLMGQVAMYRGDYKLAMELSEEGTALSRKLGSKEGISHLLAHSLGNLGYVALVSGDYGRAAELTEESLALWREVASIPPGLAWLPNLGLALFRQGDHERATKLCEEALALSRELGLKEEIARSLHHLGVVVLNGGDYGRAAELFREGLAVSWEIGDKWDLAWCLEGLAEAVVAQGQPERGARLFGIAEALREEMGAPLPPSDRPEYDRSVAAVSAGLGEEAFVEAWEAGRKMTLEEAVEYAVRVRPIPSK